MSDHEEATTSGKPISAASCRSMASLFHYGNLVALTVIVLLPLWFGISILVFALNRHHPEPRVRQYTQLAAHRFYVLTGLLIPAATLIPGDGWGWYLIAWAVAAGLIIPLSIRDLIRIRREEWHDVMPEQETH